MLKSIEGIGAVLTMLHISVALLHGLLHSAEKKVWVVMYVMVVRSNVA